MGQMQSLPTDWRTGIATNYGGAQDGDDPSSPSYGTSIGSCGYAFSVMTHGSWICKSFDLKDVTYHAAANFDRKL